MIHFGHDFISASAYTELPVTRLFQIAYACNLVTFSA